MRLLLCWFSGTGNSFAVARELAGRIEDAALMPVAKALRDGIPPAERVGIVFPVHGWGMPVIVANLLREMTVNPDTYVFTVATYGMNQGGPHREARSILRKRGRRLSAGWSIQMPEVYTPWFNPPLKEKQQLLFDCARDKIQYVASVVHDKAAGPVEDTFLPFALAGLTIHRMAASEFRHEDRKFRTLDSCTSCGLCERICPVENIRMVDGRPQWQHRCEQCLACLHWCPVEALQFGRRSEKRRRYHHPDVRPEDLAIRRSPPPDADSRTDDRT